MRKTVWILNHYAVKMYFERGGRHYALAKHLLKKGYRPIIICANVGHNIDKTMPIKRGICKIKDRDGIRFVFIKITPYGTSKVKRVLSMFEYYTRVIRAARIIETPDVIIGSSVHPLACVAANKLARRYHCKSICEIRDLWPESIAAYGILSAGNPLMKMMYAAEKWIYRKADRIVMTWAGGYDYIIKKKWENAVPREKVVHISNGVDIEDFRKNMREYVHSDEDLNRKDVVKFVYTGSIRYVNNLKLLVDAAEILKKRGNKKALLLVWGEGDERESLMKLADEKGLDNIIFKGVVPKRYVPSILAQADVSMLHNTSTALDIYGQSQNKFFEYLAAGHPILMTYSVGHSVVRSSGCGIELDEQTPETVADAIERLSMLTPEEYASYCDRAAETVLEYDFAALGDKLIEIIES